MAGKTTGGPGPAPRDARDLLVVFPAGLLGVALAWALAVPELAPVAALFRVVADGAGAAVLGLAALPRLHDRLATPWRLIAALAGLWCVAEFAVLLFEAADVVGVPLRDLGADDFTTFLTEVSGGQIGVALLCGALAVTGYAVFGHRAPDRASPDLLLICTAVVLALRPITGHMSQQALGSVLAAVHALAASAWFGLLVALALVVRTRGEWAVVLPRYSTVAVPLVVTVALTGVINGMVRLGSLAALVDTGYGRVLCAKTVVLVALLALGWWWRRTWVPKAAAHRMGAGASLGRAVLEVTVMAVAFGLAAALAVTA